MGLRGESGALGPSHTLEDTVWKKSLSFLLLCPQSALSQPFGLDPRHKHTRSLPLQERPDPLWCYQIEGPCFTVATLFGVAASKPHFRDMRASGLRCRLLSVVPSPSPFQWLFSPLSFLCDSEATGQAMLQTSGLSCDRMTDRPWCAGLGYDVTLQSRALPLPLREGSQPVRAWLQSCCPYSTFPYRCP